MVKNFGGNKSKKQGRKFVGTPGGSKALRLAEEEGELFACVTKMFGHGMLDAMCLDGVERLCVIRKKFRGRGKQENNVKIGTWILIGLREWETTVTDKKDKCDLLEVYRDDDKDKIMQRSNKDFTAILKLNDFNSVEENDSSVVFVDEQTQSYLNAAENKVVEEENDDVSGDCFGEIDFDDI